MLDRKTVREMADKLLDRRKVLLERLLAVCESYSGEIFDISRSGFSFRIAHIRHEEENIVRTVKPSPSRILHISAVRVRHRSDRQPDGCTVALSRPLSNGFCRLVPSGGWDRNCILILHVSDSR